MSTPRICPSCNNYLFDDEAPKCVCANNLAPESAHSLHAVLGDTEGQILNRPTAAGWWWTRPDARCEWRIVEITIESDGRMYKHEVDEEDCDALLESLDWWEWDGPLTPPVSPNVRPFGGQP